MGKNALHYFRVWRQLRRSSFSCYVPSLLPLARFCKELANTVNCFIRH